MSQTLKIPANLNLRNVRCRPSGTFGPATANPWHLRPKYPPLRVPGGRYELSPANLPVRAFWRSEPRSPMLKTKSRRSTEGRRRCSQLSANCWASGNVLRYLFDQMGAQRLAAAAVLNGHQSPNKSYV